MNMDQAMDRPIRVLLVEDSPGDADLLREAVGEVAALRIEWTVQERLDEALQCLREAGEARFGPNGSEGQRRGPGPGFDVILLDLSLPDTQGFETFRKASAQARDVPIVVLTGLDDEELAVRTVQAGAQDYLVKGQIDGPLVVRAMRYAIERKQAERRLATQYAVTRVLAEATTLAEASPRILQSICESMGWELGEIWSVDRQANLLRFVDLWHAPATDLAEFEALSRELTFAPGDGLPGCVWTTGEPAWVADISEDTEFGRAAAAAHTDLHGAFAFPIRVENTITGVIQFLSAESKQPDESTLLAIAALGSQIGQFMERKRAEEERARLLVLEREKSEQLKLSIREAHHRIKNNLQAISDLLYLELTSGDAASPQDALRESIDRVQAIATVHDLLSQDEDVRVVDARAVMDRLVPMALRSSGLSADAVAVTIDVQPVPLSSKRATVLALVVNELVSNAVKHACKGDQDRAISVSLRQDSEELVLRVRDNGPGLPAGFSLDTHSHVGLDVVRTLAERDLNGCFNLKSEGGVLAEVRFVW
jgi:two-component sensor histidine kinase